MKAGAKGAGWFGSGSTPTSSVYGRRGSADSGLAALQADGAQSSPALNVLIHELRQDGQQDALATSLVQVANQRKEENDFLNTCLRNISTIVRGETGHLDASASEQGLAASELKGIQEAVQGLQDKVQKSGSVVAMHEEQLGSCLIEMRELKACIIEVDEELAAEREGRLELQGVVQRQEKLLCSQAEALSQHHDDAQKRVQQLELRPTKAQMEGYSHPRPGTPNQKQNEQQHIEGREEKHGGVEQQRALNAQLQQETARLRGENAELQAKLEKRDSQIHKLEAELRSPAVSPSLGARASPSLGARRASSGVPALSLSRMGRKSLSEEGSETKQTPRRRSPEQKGFMTSSRRFV